MESIQLSFAERRSLSRSAYITHKLHHDASHQMQNRPNFQVVSLIKDSPDLYKTLGYLNHASDYPCPLCRMSIDEVSQRALIQATDSSFSDHVGALNSNCIVHRRPQETNVENAGEFDDEDDQRENTKRMKIVLAKAPSKFARILCCSLICCQH